MRPNLAPIQLRSPSAVISAVPFLLGFAPFQSLVLVLLGPADPDVAVVRVDLPLRPPDEVTGQRPSSADSPASGPPGSASPRAGPSAADPSGTASPQRERFARWIAEVVPAHVLQHAGPGAQAAVLVFGDAPVRADALPWRDLVRAVGGWLDQHGQHPVVSAYAFEDSWWEYAADDEGARVTHGRVLDADGIAVAFAFADRGEGFASTRAELERTYPAPDHGAEPSSELIAAERAIASARRAGPGAWGEHRRALESRIRAALCRADCCLCPDAMCASEPAASPGELRAGLALASVREPILHTLCTAGDTPRRHRAVRHAASVLDREARAAVDRGSAPIFAVLAVLHWQMGRGTLAGLAAEAALDRQPGMTLPALVSAAVRQGLPPRYWARTMRQFTLEELRREPEGDP